MPTIRDLLRDDLVIEEIKAADKMGVIHEFSRLLKSTGKIENEEELVRMLMERESLGSTGIGDGVAIPHAKLHFLSDMIVAFGKSSKGVDFQSLDEKPVYLFFLLITPDDKPGEHLKALARISRILKNPVLRENLKKTSDRNQLQRLIYEEDKKYPQPQGTLHK
jgi:PTS system nitrogen regulatory IIA component